jgi:hypothetical protein
VIYYPAYRVSIHLSPSSVLRDDVSSVHGNKEISSHRTLVALVVVFGILALKFILLNTHTHSLICNKIYYG